MTWLRIPATLAVLAVAVVHQTLAVQRDSLYPFGEFRNDQRMSIGDDISTSEIQLKTPIAFYENTYRSIFINLNGHLSFETEVPAYKSDLILPFGFKVIAPFLADVDTRLSGNVYYRETQDPSLLETATREIQRNFPRAITFSAESLLIVTWDMVGYFKEKYDQTNTFQVVVASDSFDSYVFFHYVDDGLNWVKSEGKNTPVHPDPPAQAGFDSGDFTRYYTLPGSGHPEVRNLAGWSNINVPGAWLFRIGDLGGGNIELPPSADPGTTPNPGQMSCASGGARTCHSEATCEDLAGGFCCKCNSGYYGNGINCLQIGAAQRISGRVSGSINGVVIEPVVLHAYVVTSDGRAYTAVSRMPELIGNSLQTAYTIGGVMGWLFALPSSPNSQNGFAITGGKFNRSAVLQFVAGGETLRINEHFEGQGVHGNMKVTATLSGTIPTLGDKARVTVDDYKEEYKRTAPGEIKSFTTHTYRLDGVPYRVTVDQTIIYQECAAAPPRADSQSLSVNRNFITFDYREQIVRYAQSNRILATSGGGGAPDPCANTPCGPNSRCLAEGTRYTCQCNNGYRGDAEGKNCADIDECAQGTHDCDPNAQCANFEGTFDCRCNQGYRGNGRQCERAFDDCSVLRNCGSNARCVYDDTIRRHRCVCERGYTGDGYRCQAEQEDCSVANICDYNAQCEVDEINRRYVCRCNQGYEGDGFTCRQTVVSCNQINNCDPNAECFYDDQSRGHVCRCLQGYEGDGYTCTAILDCLRDPSMCDRNARCVRQGYDHVCICERGYRGDGRRCISESGGDTGSYLMYAQGLSIMQMPMNPTDAEPGKQTLLIPGQTAVGIDVDCYSRYFYWTDISGKAISRARLDGTDSEVLVTGLGSPEGVAVDWVAGNMYWTDSELNVIEVSKVDGTNRKALFSNDIHDPRAIAVDPISGMLFWTDWRRTSPKIEVAHMDGTGRRVLIDTDLGLPNGLAVDYRARQVCWADAGTMHIECVNYDGRGRRTVYALASYPFGLTLSNDVFYWTDWDMKSLPSIDKFGGTPNEPKKLPVGGNGKMYGISTVRSQCPAGSNACVLNNGGCRFLCLPTPNGGRTCTCPDDIEAEECNRINLLK